MQKLKVLDLFSGIGGFSLGLERTGGFETVAFCEIEPFCQKVLKKHWPEVPIFEDVRTLDYEGTVDVITGGYPCQPFSTAGNRKGAKDDRHLWPTMFDLIKKHRPSWVIGENVAGHISMGLDRVLDDLASENYRTRAFVIPACSIGLPQRRNRLWIIANTGSPTNCKQTTVHKREKFLEEICKDGFDIWGKYNRTLESYVSDRGDDATSRIFCRDDNGVSGRVDRVRSCGNAVVPLYPEIIGEAILHSLNVPQTKDLK